MAELNIKETVEGDVVVLYLDGKITIGEAVVTLRSTVSRLLAEGRKKFVMNFARVGYIDSSGTGEVFGTVVSVTREGGRLIFCHPTEKTRDLWAITKVHLVYDIVGSVEEAIALLAGKLRHCLCPIDGCRDPLTWVGPHPAFGIRCPKCAAMMSLRPSPDAANTARGRLAVSELSLPTYSSQWVKVVLNAPPTITVRRLDLFSYDVLAKAWQTVPTPRRVVFDLRQAQEVTQAGLDALLGLCAGPGEDRGVVLLGTAATGLAVAAPYKRLTFEDMEAALAALAEAPAVEPPPLTVEFWEEPD